MSISVIFLPNIRYIYRNDVSFLEARILFTYFPISDHQTSILHYGVVQDQEFFKVLKDATLEN